MLASCRVSRAVVIALTALAAVATTQRAEAAPPSITGAPITVLIPPAPGVAFTINLRERGAIAGSAPLIIQPTSLQILVNGNVTATLQAALFPNNGPGRTCVTIRNADHTPTPSNLYQLRFQVGGLPGNSTTPVQNVPIVNAPGNIVDTPAEEAACNDPNTPPVANAGPDRTIADTNGQPGEPVVLQGSGTDADVGTVLAYAWFNAAGQQIATGPTPTVTLADGVHTLTLRATDDSFDPQTSTDTDTVTITVSPPIANQPPTANAGADRTIADSNGAPGEVVALNGSQSTDPDGAITTYQWFRVANGVETLLGTGVTLNAALADGAHTIRLRVTDDDDATDADDAQITVTPPANQPPTANAGADRTIADTNGAPGEVVALNGGQSSDADGEIATYQWFRVVDSVSIPLGAGVTLNATLPDGANTVRLLVTDDDGATDDDTAQITVTAPPTGNQPPVANAGPDRTVSDANGAPGETVALNGSQSTDADGRIVAYEWYRIVGAENEVLIGRGAALNAPLPDGVNNIRLIVTDDDEASDDDIVTITVTPPVVNGSPTANAGPDRTINDTNNAPGEPVTLDGTLSSDPEGPLARYQWFRVSGEADALLGTGATLTTTLPDGVNDVRLVVTDSAGETASDLVQIIVNALNSTPTVNAGADQIAPDTDRNPGELVSLTGGATDIDGSIASYQWFLGETLLGTGASLQTRLPNGVNIVTLAATDDTGAVGRDTVQITVGVPATRAALADLPNLDPNLRRTAQALDRICTQLDSLDDVATNVLSADQLDLRNRCDAIYFDPSENSSANQVEALNALAAEDFAVARTQTLLFANTQYASIMDRLIALRGGARGLSLAGLNIMVDGKMLPLAELRDMVQGLLGGGASSDADLLSDKWGMWARGNYSFGDKSDDRLSPSFDADQWALVGGVDYRLSAQAVIGAALSYGDSTIDFAASDGGLDTASWAVSLYASAYAAKNFYLDAILNVANSSYEARRNIVYNNGLGLVDLDAGGDTDGMVLSGGASAGYDFLLGRMTVSPNLGFFYIDANIDGFTESGAGGLNLVYDEQNFKSLTGNLGVRLTYPWNLPWGVLMPHLRVDYVREFEDDVDVFGVRFAADPNAASAPPILIETDNPDQSYFRIAAGFSAQFRYGFSGYVEYQRLEGFQSISFQDVSVGLRMQRSF